MDLEDLAINLAILFIVLLFIGIPVLYFLVPGSRPVIKAIGCAFNPTSCAIQNIANKNLKKEI